MSQCGQKVAPVVGHDDGSASRSGDFCDMRIVDASASHAVLGRRVQ